MDKVFEIKPGQFVFGVPVLKSVIGDYDPRASLCIMFTPETAMHVQYCQRL
jgi:hypothetical protein